MEINKVFLFKYLRYLISFIRHKRYRIRLNNHKLKKTILFEYLDGWLLLDKDSNSSKFIVGNNLNYEPAIQRIMRSVVGESNCILELGASVGIHTVLLSKLAPKGKVYAFEADKNTAERLRTNLYLSRCQNVDILTDAVSECKGEVEFFSSKIKKFSPNNSLIKESLIELGISEEDITSEKVNTISIDEFVNEQKITPHFIKIDIEGSEMNAFRGMKKTLSNFSPILIFEANRFFLNQDSLRELNEIFDANYNIHIIDGLEELEYPLSHFLKKPKYPSLDMIELKDLDDDVYLLCLPKT